MAKWYLVYLAQSHPGFRKAELESIADLLDIEASFESHDMDHPFMTVLLEDDEQAMKLAQRSIFVRGVYELWGGGSDLDSLHADVKSKSSHYWPDYMTCSFKFDLVGYQGKRNRKDQVQLFESFAYLAFEGPIKMKQPDQIFTILEEYHVVGREPAATPDRMWLGRQVALGQREFKLLENYHLKNRSYTSTTSFEAELSLITCNIAQAAPGKLLYDPFTGTGSFLVAAAYFGALCFGSDIDIRVLRGKDSKSIKTNFKQYGKGYLLGDVLTMDFTHDAFRKSLRMDTVVCDPPYGIREGVKVCGAKNEDRFVGKESVLVDGQLAHTRRDYIQPKKPYELDALLDDLLQFASERLPIGGRLCFWMPTENDAQQESRIPQHHNLELRYNLVQSFDKWARRLLCYVKRDDDYVGTTLTKDQRTVKNNFRARYFQGFNKQPST
ncbi:hypothetical protein LJB42_002052 [Komagataella kurtzmanii]|nr:hypothetical protein LJB42_002052 [Komagataella kurtzmanii]